MGARAEAADGEVEPQRQNDQRQAVEGQNVDVDDGVDAAAKPDALIFFLIREICSLRSNRTEIKATAHFVPTLRGRFQKQEQIHFLPNELFLTNFFKEAFHGSLETWLNRDWLLQHQKLEV